MILFIGYWLLRFCNAGQWAYKYIFWQWQHYVCKKWIIGEVFLAIHHEAYFHAYRLCVCWCHKDNLCIGVQPQTHTGLQLAFWEPAIVSLVTVEIVANSWVELTDVKIHSEANHAAHRGWFLQQEMPGRPHSSYSHSWETFQFCHSQFFSSYDFESSSWNNGHKAQSGPHSSSLCLIYDTDGAYWVLSFVGNSSAFER